MTAPDVFIAGGGPAGSAAAIELARAGMRVTLAEQSRAAHDKVCGEFLSNEGLPLLSALGIDPAALGACSIDSVRLAAGRVEAETRLRAQALSLTRRVLDEALLARAAAAGATVLRGCTVESLTHSEAGGLWRAEVSGASRRLIESRHAFLATGKHNLRGWPRELRRTQSDLIAFKMYFRLAAGEQAALDGHVELILYRGGYAGLQMVEGGRANLCLLVTRELLDRLGDWGRLLDHLQLRSRHLAERLRSATPLLTRPLAISAIPYGYCVSEPDLRPSPWRVGDQAAVIPSFCGEGITLALATARRAAEMCLDGRSPAEFQMEARRSYLRKLGLVTALSRLIVAAPFVAEAVRLRPPVLATVFRVTRLGRGDTTDRGAASFISSSS